MGNVRIEGSLEETQAALGEVIGAILRAGAVPIVLGGGHETAYGHYLGYVAAGLPVGVVNIDAHLDVRPLIDGKGHSGSPFRQMMEHPTYPLPGKRYFCLGVQPQSLSQAHWRYARERGCRVFRASEVALVLKSCLESADDDFSIVEDCHLFLSIDADAVRVTDVPGVSAPNLTGLLSEEVLETAREAGRRTSVASFDLVEINPSYDRDGQSARWAALVVWNFLVGLAGRRDR
jgi:formiminoglutamase